MNNNLFSKRIKNLRIAKKMTQQELGNIVGLTATGVSYWESGKATPSIEVIEKLSNFFGVSIDFLMGKPEIDENDRSMILFRKAEQVNETDREKLYHIINNTIDVFLANQENKNE